MDIIVGIQSLKQTRNSGVKRLLVTNGEIKGIMIFYGKPDGQYFGSGNVKLTKDIIKEN